MSKVGLKFYLKDGSKDCYDPVDMDTFTKDDINYKFECGIYDYEVLISSVDFYEEY